MYLIYDYGILPIVLLLSFSAVIETIFILLQRDQNLHPNHHYFNYLLQMGGRYTGTLSNPIHSAGFLVLTLTVSLYIPFLIHNVFGILLFM